MNTENRTIERFGKETYLFTEGIEMPTILNNQPAIQKELYLQSGLSRRSKQPTTGICYKTRIQANGKFSRV